MADVAERRATYADMEALPPHVTGEILFAAFCTRGRTARQRGDAASALSALMTNAYQLGIGGSVGWTFIVEPALHLSEHVIVPDIAAWRNVNVTEPATQAHCSVAPDWACEITSPGTEQRDRALKRRIFATFGVGHLWFVDPRSRIVEAFELRDGAYSLLETFTGDVDVSAAPFGECSFDLDLLWPFDKPSQPSDRHPALHTESAYAH
ncbi:MAG: Uma2 family endonuclease [Pseudomonadota bacterium]